MKKTDKMEKQTSGVGITQETVIIEQSPERIAELSAAMEKTGFFSAIPNKYGALHGGVVASVAEVVAEACAKTVMGNEKNLFLGELSNSYLSSAQSNTEVMVEESIVRRGRNVTVVSVEFRMKESDKLVYTSRATFYNMPLASL